MILSFLQKWERENASLPKHLQRKPPLKPTVDAKNREEWNNVAWEAAQVRTELNNFILSSFYVCNIRSFPPCRYVRNV